MVEKAIDVKGRRQVSHFPLSTGYRRICQCLYDEKAALTAFLLHFRARFPAIGGRHKKIIMLSVATLAALKKKRGLLSV
jgi:hypothetical protein